MRMQKVLMVVAMLMIAGFAAGQSARLRGKVLDSSGLVMPGAQIKVFQGDKLVKDAVSGSTGEFDISVASGDYRVEVSAADFQPARQNVRVTPTMGALTISMKLAAIAQNVNVAEEGSKVNIDSDSSLNTMVLKEDFIDQLPSDENELAAYLANIAGSRGDASGQANFVVDGFTGGVIPPKEQIQEVRINNNPYSTEFSGIGFGRVEIITRAGTGAYHGNFNFNFKDDKLNAQIPFSNNKPPYQQRSFNSSMSGPLIRNRLTISLNGRNNYTDNSDTINATIADGTHVNSGVLKPSISRAINGRGQLALTRNNTLNFNLNYDTQTNKNQGIGNNGGSNFNLATRATNRKNSGIEAQIRETAILNPRLVHEVRFEYGRDLNNTTSLSQAFQHNVLDSFSDGGAQNTSDTRTRTIEAQNVLMYSGVRWTVKTGTQTQYRMNHTFNQSNFTGACTFSSLADFNNNKPLVCSQNRGNPLLDDNQFTLSSFLQNDYKVKRNLTLSFGTRYEIQTNISDHNNLDPRVAIGYGIGQNTVLRVGAGVFHQRLEQGTLENLLRLDGTRQFQIVVNDFSTNPYDPAHSETVFGNGRIVPPASIRVRSTNLVTPYSANTSISFERSLPKNVGMTISWDTVRGVHRYRSRNLNAPPPDRPGVRPDPTVGNIYQLESTGFSRSSNYTIGFRQTMRNRWNLNLFGNYTLGWSRNDTDGPFGTPMNNYALRSEWGRSPEDTRHRFFTGAGFSLPGGFNVNSNVNFNTGRAYNITTGRDDNGDTVINDRPAGVPRNSGIGPRNMVVNMNLTKVIRLRRQESPARRAGNPFVSSFLPPQEKRGEGGGPGGFGGQRGGEDRGGDRGGPGPVSGGSTYNPTVNFQLNVNNLLNTTQLGQFSGVMTSQYFGRAAGARNPRTVELGMRFNF